MASWYRRRTGDPYDLTTMVIRAVALVLRKSWTNLVEATCMLTYVTAVLQHVEAEEAVLLQVAAVVAAAEVVVEEEDAK